MKTTKKQSKPTKLTEQERLEKFMVSFEKANAEYNKKMFANMNID